MHWRNFSLEAQGQKEWRLSCDNGRSSSKNLLSLLSRSLLCWLQSPGGDQFEPWNPSWAEILEILQMHLNCTAYENVRLPNWKYTEFSLCRGLKDDICLRSQWLPSGFVLTSLLTIRLIIELQTQQDLTGRMLSLLMKNRKRVPKGLMVYRQKPEDMLRSEFWGCWSKQGKVSYDQRVYHYMGLFYAWEVTARQGP